jgi:excisionase family DNA binding protein
MTATLHATAVLKPEGPTQQQAAALEAFLTFIHEQANATGDTTVMRLTAADSRTVDVPPQMVDLLQYMARTLAQGDTVTVSTISREISTGEAAKILGMSRPTVVKLLDTDQISSRKVGTHRRVVLRDVLQFRDRVMAERRKAYEALMEDCDALGMDE